MSAWVYLDWSGGVHVCCKWRVENVNLFSSSKKEKLVLVPKSHVVHGRSWSSQVYIQGYNIILCTQINKKICTVHECSFTT